MGVGKTMILDFFFNDIKETKQRLHFNEFMLNFHNFIHERKNKKDIQITLVSGPLPLPIYDDYPNIIRRIILKKENYNLHWWKLYKELTPFKFDEIFDFRSSLISYFLRSKKRTVFNNFFSTQC